MPTTAHSPSNRQRVAVLLAGQQVDAVSVRHDSMRYQDLLRTAKVKFGHGLCQCHPRPLHLVIRERTNKLFLACWPDESHLHALDCPFYQAADSTRDQYAADAIEFAGDALRVRLHHPVKRTTGNNRSVHKGTEAVHLWGLLHLLWEESGLNRWQHGWSRDWGMVRWLLRRVAQSTFVDTDVALLNKLYIPPVWAGSDTKKADIDKAWRAFKQPLLTCHRSQPVVESGFVIGIVRSLDSSMHGFVIKLRHHAEPFFFDANTSDMFAQYSRSGWSDLRVQRNEGHQPSIVVAALRIQATPKGSLVVIEGALMKVSRHFIPVSSASEQTVAERLVDQSRSFVRPLHYDLHRDRLPHFVLIDCANTHTPQDAPDRTCLFVYGSLESHHMRKVNKDDEAGAKARGCSTWKWLTSETGVPPPFPLQWAKPTGNSQSTQGVKSDDSSPTTTG